MGLSIRWIEDDVKNKNLSASHFSTMLGLELIVATVGLLLLAPVQFHDLSFVLYSTPEIEKDSLHKYLSGSKSLISTRGTT